MKLSLIICEFTTDHFYKSWYDLWLFYCFLNKKWGEERGVTDLVLQKLGLKFCVQRSAYVFTCNNSSSLIGQRIVVFVRVPLSRITYVCGNRWTLLCHAYSPCNDHCTWSVCTELGHRLKYRWVFCSVFTIFDQWRWYSSPNIMCNIRFQSLIPSRWTMINDLIRHLV